MQSQGPYTHRYTLAQTQQAKTRSSPPKGQSVLNRITAISHSVGGDRPQQKSNIYHVVLTPTAALHTDQTHTISPYTGTTHTEFIILLGHSSGTVNSVSSNRCM